MKCKLREITGGYTVLVFKPNGYDNCIMLPIITKGSRDKQPRTTWTWNGDFEKPTLKPSIRTDHGNGKISHIWLTDGMCQHLEDSTDGFAGQQLPLCDIDDNML